MRLPEIALFVVLAPLGVAALWACPGSCLAKPDSLQSFNDNLWDCAESCLCSYGVLQDANGRCSLQCPTQAGNRVALPSRITDCTDPAQYTCAQGYYQGSNGVCTVCQPPPPSQTCPLGKYQKRCQTSSSSLQCFACYSPALNQTSQQYGPQVIIPPCSPCKSRCFFSPPSVVI